jgi:autotransporter translocation and assembly factor TamB
MPGIEATLGGKINVTGRLREPVLSATVTVNQLHSTHSRLGLPVDLHLAAQYDRRTGRFGGGGEVLRDGRRVAHLSTRARIPWEGLWQPASADQPLWQGEATLHFDGLPIGVLPVLADNDIEGLLSGDVTVQREALLPTATADLRLGEASVQHIAIGEGTLAGTLGAQGFTGDVRFHHAARSLAVHASGSLRWPGLIPELDEAQPTTVALRATRFDAVVLQPLLRGALSRLSGDVDGSVTAVVSQQGADWGGQLRGTLRLRRGSLQVAGLGLSLDDVQLDLVARTEDGKNLVEITDLRGKARSEQHNLVAQGKLTFDGFAFRSGTASLRTVGENVPVQIGGVTLATAKGHATASIERRTERMLVAIEIPELELRLPASTDRELVALAPHADIVIDQPIGEPETSRTETALPWRLVIALGDQVRVVRSDLSIPITGQPVVDLQESAVVTGTLDLEPGGRLEALGKDFTIKAGRLLFDTGENDNPYVDITAAWQGPESTVYVEIHGTASRATLSFRSDPPRPESEIVALLLTGTTEDMDQEQGSQEAGLALGAGSQAAAPLVDKLLRNTPLAGVKLQATATGGKPSYTAAYRVTDEVWLEGIYKPEGGLETQSGGSDISGQGRQDAFAGAIDYRFHRDWSLRTEAGNASAGLDILWQYRY